MARVDALGFARLLWLRRKLGARDRWPRQQLLAHQAAALARLRGFALERSAFYRDFHAGLANRPLEELPILTKDLAMEQFDRIVTDPRVRIADVQAHVAAGRGNERYLGRYLVSVTSGSTGTRGIFIFDPDEWRMVLASFGRGTDWAGLVPRLTRRSRLATVTTRSAFHMSALAGASLPRFWLPALRLDAGAPLVSLVARLNTWRPEVLFTYPSIAVMLAEEQVEGRLAITPRIVETGAEVLTESTRRLIEVAWGCRIFDQYGATETGVIAAECEAHRGLHVFEDLLVVEAVDAAGRAVAPGTFGSRLLFTVLFGRSLPLIRYELSDQVSFSPEPCTCARPYRLIDAIEGRAEESLALPARGGGTARLHPIIFHQLLDSVAVRAWQIVYEPDRGLLEVQVVGFAGNEFPQRLAEALRRTLKAHGAEALTVSVREVPEVERGATGKAPRIRTRRSKDRTSTPLNAARS